MPLKKIDNIDPRNQAFKVAFNDLVDEVLALKKMSASSPLVIKKASGVPTISFGKKPFEADLYELKSNLDNGEVNGVGYYYVYDPDTDSFVRDPNNKEEPDIACPMGKEHLQGEILMGYPEEAERKIGLIPFTYWQLMELTSPLQANSTASAKILKFDTNDSGLNATVYSLFQNHDELATGTRIKAVQHRQSKEWCLFAADCP